VNNLNPDDPISGYQGIPRNMTGIAEVAATAGYSRHYVGKWDAGMATPDHTPVGRGYESFTGYFQHANSYWNKEGHIEATGDVDLCLNVFTDMFIENATYRGGVLDSGWLDDSCSSSDDANPACYEEKIFMDASLEVIDDHDFASAPLFLTHAFHLIHSPLQVPNSYLTAVDEIIAPYEFDSASRRNYSAMVHYMDDVVGAITDKLKDEGVWDNTVVMLLSDNGGPLYLPGSGNNHPLKGGKYSDWEGGIRTNALISGGYIPEDRRGTVYDKVVSIADWYGMISELVGVADFTDKKAEAANDWIDSYNARHPLKADIPRLPPVDSVPGVMKSILSGDGEAVHHANLALSANAFLQYPYKLITGRQPYSNHTGALYPNCTTITDTDLTPWHNDSNLFGANLPWSKEGDELDRHLWAEDCEDGCLFDVQSDPNETNDLKDALGDKFEELKNLLTEANKDLFTPDRGEEVVEACLHGMDIGGYYGPFVDIDDYHGNGTPYYTGPFREFKTRIPLYEQLIKAVAHDRVEDKIVDIVRGIYPYVIRPPLVCSFDMCINPEVANEDCDGKWWDRDAISSWDDVM
jgi:arylsulfatase I/J